MSIRCPNCKHRIALTDPKAGHYTPTCPACKQRFDLLIPRGEGESPRVSKIGSPATAMRTAAPRDNVTVAKVAKTTTTPRDNATVAPVTKTTTARDNATIAPGATTAKTQPAQPDRAPAAKSAASRIDETAPPKSRVDRSQYFTKANEPDEAAYDDLTGDVSGYDILKKLGQGGMGSVYLARQISLDRNVALKTLSPMLAMDPSFVARFTREAYAAAQLNHHNVVQIHDIGQDRGTNFYSMELVEGQNLAQVVEHDGRLDPVTAVSYVLQAARGLKFAHARGLIHRDVKPENLLLNTDGVVKVADLGLVKRAGVTDAATTNAVFRPPTTAAGGAGGQHATQLNTAMGTPAYMAPEQARDASKVDQRADIYSLGCSLYDLITGRPPFSGRSAIEVMTKHQREPITPPDKIVTDLPKRLSEIVQLMTAKAPEARYQSMDDVVRDLEDFLGVEHGGGVRASQDAIKIVTGNVERFNAAPFAAFRAKILVAFFAICALIVVFGVVTLSPRVAIGAAVFCATATLAYQVTIGLTKRTPLFVKIRHWLFGAGVGDWLTSLAALLIAALILHLLGQLWTCVAVAVAAAFAGSMFHFFVDHVVTVEHEEPLREVEKLVREMRVKGIDEEGIRGFIAKFSGHKWEAFYEAMFGYDAKIDARRLYGKGERGRDRKRQAVWRDWILAWVDRRVEWRKQHRERKLLERLERKALMAKGASENMAARQAKQSAAAVVENALQMRSRAAETLAPTEHGDRRPTTLYVRPEWLDADRPQINDSLEDYQRHGYLRRRYGTPIDVLLGQRVRLLLAAIVLVGATRWVQINGGFTSMANEGRALAAANIDETQAGTRTQLARAVEREKMLQREKTSSTSGGDAAASQPATPAATAEPVQESKPLRVPHVPDWLCDSVGSWNGLTAGGILLASVLIDGHVAVMLGLACAAFALFGSWPDVPGLGHLSNWVTGIAATAVALPGMFFLRRTRD